MADITSTQVSFAKRTVFGDMSVHFVDISTGAITTAAAAEDTVFTGVTQVVWAQGQYMTTAANTTNYVLTVFPSTVTAGRAVVRHASTHDNFPVRLFVIGSGR